jgi:hypothetical protein
MGSHVLGAHEVKRDQPVKLFRRERVTEAETEATGYDQELPGIRTSMF